jgi:hypothetical protein
MNLKERIIANMPDGLSDLYKARYLYVELAKRVSFSTKFQNTDEKTFAEMYNSVVDINTFKKNQVICRQWSQLYSQLLDLCNINNQIINMGHSWVVFEADGEKWNADATIGSYTDLARVHNGDETSSFGPLFYQRENAKIEHNFIRCDEETTQRLRTIDKELGYDTPKRKKLEELKNLLENIRNGKFDIKEILPESEIEEKDELVLKLEFLFSKLGTLGLGFYETKDFVYEMENILLTKEELERVGSVDLKRTNLQKNVDILQCIYVKTGEDIQHYLVSPNLPIRKTCQSEIINLSLLGYGIGDKSIPGLLYPKIFVAGKISTNLPYLFTKNFGPSWLKKYDFDQTIITSNKSK